MEGVSIQLKDEIFSLGQLEIHLQGHLPHFTQTPPSFIPSLLLSLLPFLLPSLLYLGRCKWPWP